MAEERDIKLEIKTALDKTETDKGLKETKKLIKELKDLAFELGDETSEDFKKITAAVAELNDRIKDQQELIANQTGEPIEKIGNSFKGLKGSLDALDLKQAGAQWKILMGGVKDFGKQMLQSINIVGNFRKAQKEGKSATDAAGAALKALGPAVAATLIPALVAAVVMLISNFDKLKESGGKIGKIFTAIGDMVQFVMDKIIALSDAFGLTDIQNQKRLNNSLKGFQKEREAISERYDAEIQKAEAAGKNTDSLLKKKNAALAYSINQEIKGLMELQKSKGKLNDEELQQLRDLYKERNDLVTQNQVVDIKAQTDAAAEAARKRAQNKKDIDDHAKEVQTLKDKYTLDEREKLAKSFDDDIKKLNSKNAKERKLIEEIQKDKKAALDKYDKAKADDDLKKEQDAESKLIAQNERFTDIEEKYGLKRVDVEQRVAKLGEQYTKISYDEKLALLEKQLDKEEKIKQKGIETDKEIADAGFKALEGKGQKQIDFLDQNYKKMGLKEQEYKDLRIKLEEEVQNKIKEQSKARLDTIFQIINDVKNVASALNDFYSQQREQLLEIERTDIQSRLDLTTNQIETQKQQELEKFDMINGIEERVVTEQQARAIRRKYIEDKYNYDIAMAKYKADKEMSEAENRVALAAFRRRKALGIVSAIIDGAMAIAKIWADVPKVDFGVTTIIMTAASIANTAAQIATIASSNFTPTSFTGTPPKAPVMPSFTIGGGAGGGGGMNAPSTIGLGQANLVPLASQANWQKVYVVESDIRNTTNKVEVIENRSVLGA